MSEYRKPNLAWAKSDCKEIALFAEDVSYTIDLRLRVLETLHLHPQERVRRIASKLFEPLQAPFIERSQQIIDQCKRFTPEDFESMSPKTKLKFAATAGRLAAAGAAELLRRKKAGL